MDPEAPAASGTVPTGSPLHGDKSKTDDAPEEEEPWDVKRQKIPLRSVVEWLNFEHFKNRYSEEDGLAIIEVLVGHSQIALEVSREISKRSRGKKDIRTPTPIPKLTVDGDSHWMQRVRIQSPQLILLLSRVTGHRDKFQTERPRTFFAPFHGFHYSLPRLKQCLELLRAKWAADDDREPPALPKSPTESTEPDSKPGFERSDGNPKSSDALDSDVDDDDSDVVSNAELDGAAPDLSGDLIDSPITLTHLETFVNFIETYIESRWQHAAGTTKRKFRFTDLWMAFQPGELLYVPLSSDSPQNSDTGQGSTARTEVGRGSSNKMYQTAWRLYTMALDAVNDDKLNDTHKSSKREFDIHAYYMEYDGNSYVPVRHSFTIKYYEGERDIANLEVYPLRFAKDSEKITDRLEKQGTWFREAVAKRHLTYDGWTLTHSPTGALSESSSSDSSKSSSVEHIDGDVIIDFVEGYKSEPMLGLGPSSWSQGLSDFDDSDWPVGDDDVGILHWEPTPNGKKVQVFTEIGEVTQRGEWFGERLKREQQNGRAALKAHRDGNPIKYLEGDDLLLLPRRVVAYTFRERRFVMLDINSLKPPPASDNVFQNLKIDESHKLMVTSLVKSHLDKQKTQKLRPGASLNQDLIRGKGSGLVMLLHGVPGVGKTATAEAVAQANQKPLFVITCGDLGFTPREVESALKDIFRLAHSWDCILLLDEADIFLSRRALSDLKRNALVSVFLRVLEYYSGILFLTTNRVGTLDEAFKSRIHVSLYYPPLDKHQTLEIFKVNIEKLAQIVLEKQEVQAELEPDAPKRPRLIISSRSILDYAEWHYDVHEETPEQRWNGRQIRNAFQIAYSLAQFDMRSPVICQQNEPDGRRPLAGNKNMEDRGTPRLRVGDGQLDWRQFNMVAKAIEKFEDYLFSATSGTDRDHAYKDAIREDDYDPRAVPQTPPYNPNRYQTPRRGPPSARRPGQNAAPGSNASYYRPPNYEPPAYRPPKAERPTYRPPQAQPQQTPIRRPARQQQAQGTPNQRQLTVPGGPPPQRKNPSPNTGPPRGGGGGGGAGRGGVSPLSPSPTSAGGTSPRYTHSKPVPRQQQPSARSIPNSGTKPPSIQRSHDSGYSGWSSSTGTGTGTGAGGPRTPDPDHDPGVSQGQDWPDDAQGEGEGAGGYGDDGGELYAQDEENYDDGGVYRSGYGDREDEEGQGYGLGDGDEAGGEEEYFEDAGEYEQPYRAGDVEAKYY